MAAIERQTAPPAEVLVAIDHNDELLEWAGSQLSGAKVIRNRYERGVVGNRNSGVESANSEIVVLTDDDTEAEPDWIERLTACFSDPDVIGATGNLVPMWRNGRPAWFPPELYWVVGCSYVGLPTEVAPVRNPIAANMAVRRDALRKAGGFRKGVHPRQIHHGGRVVAGGHALEDTELGIRLTRQHPGTRWLYEPRATVHHAVDTEQATLGYLRRRCFEEGAGKAALADLVGSEQGLESERRYLRSVIPRGVLRGFTDAVRGDLAGLGRSTAIVLGIASAACGYGIALIAGVFKRDGEGTE